MKMTFLRRRPRRTRRAVWTGLRAASQNGLYPPGITIGEVSSFVPATSTEDSSYRATGRGLQHPGLRRADAESNQWAERELALTWCAPLAIIALLVTALLLQSTVFARSACSAATGADVSGGDRARDPGGPVARAPSWASRAGCSGLPPEPAEGDHRADAHSARLHGRPRAPVHRVALAAAPHADGAGGDVHRRRVLRDRGGPAGPAATDAVFFFRTTLLSALYTALLTPIVYPLLRRVFEGSRPRRVVRF